MRFLCAEGLQLLAHTDTNSDRTLESDSVTQDRLAPRVGPDAFRVDADTSLGKRSPVQPR